MERFMISPQITLSRRAAITRLMGGAAAIIASPSISSAVWAQAPNLANLTDGVISIEFDRALRSQIGLRSSWLTGMHAGEALRLAGGGLLERFTLTSHNESAIDNEHGAGRMLELSGVGDHGVEKHIAVTLYARHPGVAFIVIRFVNTGAQPLAVAGWRAGSHVVVAQPGGAWSYSGASYPDRRDWARPVTPAFQQPNFMGMNGSDYGGGTPVADVWQRDGGLAVAHIETVPKLVSFPVLAQPTGTAVSMASTEAGILAPGGELALPTMILVAHDGDYFAPLDAYRRVMAERGVKAPPIPEASYAPIWCAWGYERNFTTEQVLGALPKAKSLGLGWAVLDDGWQSSIGDWNVDRTKFPNGNADMKAFADGIKAVGMKPRLWFAPLAAAPGTDVLRDHPDMLLLDAQGAAQNVSWWNSYTLCPAYAPTVDFFRAHVRRMIGDWGFEGLKLDGQHLNGVAPCFNPAHNHARPEESYEKLQDFWKAIYDEAIATNPQAVVEICPCGDAFAFHNMPAMNNTPASDPESSWQVRLKGKAFKALMGPSAPFSGDHVELTQTREDFASSYGLGAILSTKFTWPHDTDHPTDELPPGGFVLTPAREALWRKWIGLYNARMLPKGQYRGNLYDIAFDKPEAHVVEKEGRTHFAFFAKSWRGPIALRGLDAKRYALSDPWTGRPLGIVSGPVGHLDASFENFLLVEATPIAHTGHA
jgi:alpha-galactosidase